MVQAFVTIVSISIIVQVYWSTFMLVIQHRYFSRTPILLKLITQKLLSLDVRQKPQIMHNVDATIDKIIKF